MNQVGGDRDFLDEVIQDLLNEADSAQNDIAEGINEKDFSKVMKAAHRIKGSASYLCCEALREISLKLQEAGHEGTKPDCNKDFTMGLISELFAVFQKSLDELKTEIASKK